MLAFFIIICNIMAHSQVKNNSASNSLNNTVSIYEYGDSLTSCETNFENLFRNWHNGYITNANQYSDFGSYSFVETISDSARYRYYRNYFSGLEVVWNHSSTSGSLSYDGKQWNNNKHEYFAAPFKLKWALLKEKLPIETTIKILTLFSTELKLNVDTIKINSISQESTQTIEKEQNGNSSFSDKSEIRYWAYSDSATKKSIDSIFLHSLRFDDLDVQSQEAMRTKQNLLMRVGLQKYFNSAVHIGDKVYVVPFGFAGLYYNIFVICNPVSKKVVLDYFFKNIRLPAKKTIESGI